MKTTTKTRELNVIYELKNNMYIHPYLKSLPAGGREGARAPVPPPPLNPPLGVWVLCYGTKRDACYIVSGDCLFVYNTAAPPRRQFLH